ncbi:hypothetical protein B0T10DRAFT_414669 [Thelonectria olida]|uniref:DUF1907 domain-containing protein n=1 Tax=Thelonectria olida TaxID=1576542 RepID=A0A9P8VTV4_9HYPO|nr:hypothetical protein B0T10DRAFT_414669 [Thelonectria olida]
MTHVDWPVQKLTLAPPPLDDLATAIRDGIKPNFSAASVTVSTPPDLRKPPFHLAGAGLSGNVRIADIGGQPNLMPSPNLEAKYDLVQVSGLMEMSRENGLLIGAGAGPFHLLGLNTELMPNIAWASSSEHELHNNTHFAKITEDDEVRCEKIGETTGFGLMCNLLGCDGNAGPTLHVIAKGRAGARNFTDSIRKAIHAVYGEKLISVGGVFVVRGGKVKLHVMPDFPCKPFESRKDVESWLRYFDTDGPLVCLSVFHSGDDQGLGLRMEHTHCFAGDGKEQASRGGHYHFDLDETSEDIEYEGWFNVAETLYRIDQPSTRT